MEYRLKRASDGEYVWHAARVKPLKDEDGKIMLRLDIQPVDCRAVIEASVESLRPVAEAKSIRIRTIASGEPCHISADPSRLQQVLWNLLTNAVKFTPNGGAVQVGFARVCSHVERRISDTGPGIKPDFLPYLFDRFRFPHFFLPTVAPGPSLPKVLFENDGNVAWRHCNVFGLSPAAPVDGMPVASMSRHGPHPGMHLR